MSTIIRLTMLHRIRIALLIALMLAQDAVFAANSFSGGHGSFSESNLLDASEALSIRADGDNYT